MNKKDRFYWSGKQYVPSGTTVLEKPDLTRWGANCAVDYIDKNARQELLGFDFAYTEDGLDKFFDEARTAFERESTQAADYGTYIHTLCEYSLRRGLLVESPHEMTNDFMKGFWRWAQKHKVKPLAMEQEVIGQGYGGRLDLVAEVDGIVTLVDYKTGKGSYYDNWKFQLAGYRKAFNDSIPFSDVEMFKINDTMAFIQEQVGQIQAHGILKFNKEKTNTKGYSVNWKTFDEYGATRTNSKTKEKEKYTRTWEMDLNVFETLVKLWWHKKRGKLWT